MATSGRLLHFSKALRSSLGPTNWHNLGKFASGGSPHQESQWNLLKGFDSNVSGVIDGTKDNPDLLDWSVWDDRISHKNILTHMKKTYTNTMKTLDDALSSQTSPEYLNEGWETYETVKKTCADATEAADKIISDGIKALWISQHNPPTWKVDTNEWLESDQYWQAFVEKHAMYSQSGTTNDPESPSEIESVKSKWNVNMFKFNERTDTPMLYDYMYHNPSWEYYDINRRQFFEHLEYFLLRTGEDFRNFPDVPKWKWLTHLEDLRFKQFSVEMRRKMNKQVEKASRFEKTDLGAGEHESEEDANMQLLMNEKNQLETALSNLLAGFGFLVDPLVPVENMFQLNYVLSKDNYQAHKMTKVFSLGNDLPYLYVLPYSTGTLKGENAYENSQDIKKPDPSDCNELVTNPMSCFYNLMDYMNLSGYKVNPSFSTRLQLKCQVMHERGPNWLKLPGEPSYDSFLRRLRYDDPLRPMFEEYVRDLKLRLKDAKEIPPTQWYKNLQRLKEMQAERDTVLSKTQPVESQEFTYTPEELTELTEAEQLLFKDSNENKLSSTPTKLL
ncbi:hypothetical protein TpMuguga_03g00055 [Theileria parva strain Muguga]|uniref:Uncharacterized protein n=1 Tax=Theileria parva TaxID=5875 RepID=Q4N0Q8_THEPA|nr:uncharacterized protein TpMuguga_03g00055 [Theileria parva strain Muguga]EAN30791.1 hypothetical protein TpMuguga_03g00055 [Theileria parva strain Muguga]|eukprot:XP_763074.1 hypothetical protein [Theileria parva strain Muguga]